MEREITLSFETGIAGGSISLLDGASEMDFWVGSRAVSKSVDILEETKKLLDRNNTAKNSIKRIVVSAGPGSHTGIRVGTAVGLGLKLSLSCELVSVSSLCAMSSAEHSEKIKKTEGIKHTKYRESTEVKNRAEEILAALPVGRNQVAWQSFNNSSRNFEQRFSFQTTATEDFLRLIKNNEVLVRKNEIFAQKTLILHRELFQLLTIESNDNYGEAIRLSDAGENIAGINGRAVVLNDGKNI